MVTKYEPSYYQRHLDFNGLINSTCNEYLSPNTQQNKFIRYSNPHYDKLLNIKFIPNLSFSRGEIYSAKKFIRKCTKKTFLVVTSITDNDVKEVITFLKKNKKYLRGEYDNLILRIHPEDSKSRWMPLLRKNRSIKLSKSDLKTNIMRSTEILTSSKTVALQLSSNGLNCIELGLEKKCLRY